MNVSRLLTFEKAARDIGMPVASLRSAADFHGFTIRMGRAVRLHPDDLGRLIDLCRVEPKDRASTGAPTEKPTKSAMATPAYRPAQAAASKLKANSRRTSPKSTGQVVHLNPEI